MSYFTMLVGLPGSGKSTLAAEWERDGIRFTYLSTDALVEARADELGLTYNDVWPDYIGEATRIVHEDFRVALKEGRNIVWDQTNLTVKKRKWALSQVPASYDKACVLVTVGEGARQVRLINRPGKNIPAHVDKGMRDSFEKPTTKEGFDRVVWYSSASQDAA